MVAAAALGSGMSLLDGTVVNVALKTIGEDLDASLAQLQWVTNGYLLSMASLILLGGSLGDRFGRRRIFVLGTWWFALASLLCGLAPNPEVLIAARVLQGVGGVLIDYASWRWIFLVNLPLAVVTVVIAQRWVPETRDPHAPTHFDLAGALLAVAALGGTTYALICWASTPMSSTGPTYCPASPSSGWAWR